MRKLVVAAMLVVLGLAGCGDDESTTDTTATTAGDTAASEAPVALSGKVNNEGTADATGTDELEVEADDFYFKPTFVKVTAGQKLTVKLKNEGAAAHTFTSAELGVDQELQAGDTATVEITVPSADSVTFFCRFHQGGGMQGAVFTKESAAPASGGTQTTTAPAVGY
jgi:plastocyanin